MPARATDMETDESIEDIDEKIPEAAARLPSPSPPSPTESEQIAPERLERREPPPAALVEPIPRPPPDSVRRPSSPAPLPAERSPSPEPKPKAKPETNAAPLVNGHASSECTPQTKGAVSRIGAAGIERAWSGSGEKKPSEGKPAAPWGGGNSPAPWGGGSPAPGRRPRAPPACTSVVFNFSNRKEVPDYIENDGIILRASRRNRIKPGEQGVVVLRPPAARSDSESESELDGAPPSPCAVRFVNDNVLINGRSSMPGRPDRDRIAKLKLQFDDSLTCTFEYPSETSLCEAAPEPEPPHTPQLAESPMHAPLAANTHITSAALARYTPLGTAPPAFQLGVSRHADCGDVASPLEPREPALAAADSEAEGDARPCGADAARSWSEARTHATDLLF